MKKHVNPKMTHGLTFSRTKAYERLTDVVPAAIHTGSVIIVAGPPGSGKSCLLHEVAGLRAIEKVHVHTHGRTSSPVVALQELFAPFVTIDEKEGLPKPGRVTEVARSIKEKEIDLLVLDDASAIPALALQIIFDLVAELGCLRHRIGVIMSGVAIQEQIDATQNGRSFVQTTITLPVIDHLEMLEIMFSWKVGLKEWAKSMKDNSTQYASLIGKMFSYTDGSFRRLVGLAEMLLFEADGRDLKTADISRVLGIIEPEGEPPRQLELDLDA